MGVSVILIATRESFLVICGNIGQEIEENFVGSFFDLIVILIILFDAE